MALFAPTDPLEHFEREDEALRHLDHANVVNLLDTIEDDYNYSRILIVANEKNPVSLKV
jgi:hypothetical protein